MRRFQLTGTGFAVGAGFYQTKIVSIIHQYTVSVISGRSGQLNGLLSTSYESSDCKSILYVLRPDNPAE